MNDDCAGSHNLKENVVFETVDRREYIQTSILNPSTRFEAWLIVSLNVFLKIFLFCCGGWLKEIRILLSAAADCLINSLFSCTLATKCQCLFSSQIDCCKCQVLSIKYQVPKTKYEVLSTKYRVPNTTSVFFFLDCWLQMFSSAWAARVFLKINQSSRMRRGGLQMEI